MLLFQINDDSLILLLIICSLLGALMLFYMSSQRELDQARTEGLAEYAKKMGLKFSHRGNQRLRNRLAQFSFMSRFRSSITNLIEGNTGKIHIAIFNVRYKSGKYTKYRAFLLLRSKALVCPEFRIEPESFLDKLNAIGIGWRDIDFNKYPEFSGNFLVSSPDEEHFRKFFNVDAIPFFLSHPNLCVEKKLNALLFHLPVECISAEDVEKYISAGIELYNLLIEPEQPSN